MADFDDLNKNQIILLVLLVSFVTSIATGIITAALLAEAPQSVTQTINRVVERTMETVTPTPQTSDQEGDLLGEHNALIAAINTATQAVVSINQTNTESSPTFISTGVIVSREGMIVTSRAGISATSTYTATFQDKTSLPLTLISAGPQDDIAVFKIQLKSDTAQSGNEVR